MSASTWVGSAVPVLAICLLTSDVSSEDRTANAAKVAAARQEAGLREPFVEQMSRKEAEAFFVGKTPNVSAADRGSQVSFIAPEGTTIAAIRKRIGA